MIVKIITNGMITIGRKFVLSKSSGVFSAVLCNIQFKEEEWMNDGGVGKMPERFNLNTPFGFFLVLIFF